MAFAKKKFRRILASEGLIKSASGPHPKDWKPHRMLPSPLEYGADMEGGGVVSSFKTDFGTYFHEPADDDAIWFEPKKKRGQRPKIEMLGRGNFLNARALAIKHHQGHQKPKSPPNKPYPELLAGAVLRKRTTPKIQKPISGPGSRTGGWMEFPNGRILQFRLYRSYRYRALTDDLDPFSIRLVMEAMGSEDEAEAGTGPYEEEVVNLTATGDLKKDAATVVGHLMAFAKKHHRILA